MSNVKIDHFTAPDGNAMEIQVVNNEPWFAHS